MCLMNLPITVGFLIIHSDNDVFYICSQKLSIIQQWRPLVFFLAANLDIGRTLVKKIKDLNGPIIKSEIITNLIFKDHAGLNADDLRDFGLWLTDQPRVSSKDMGHRLGDMKKRRMVRWHVYNAPDDVVSPALSMLLHLISLVSFFFTNCNS